MSEPSQAFTLVCRRFDVVLEDLSAERFERDLPLTSVDNGHAAGRLGDVPVHMAFRGLRYSTRSEDTGVCALIDDATSIGYALQTAIQASKG